MTMNFCTHATISRPIHRAVAGLLIAAGLSAPLAAQTQSPSEHYQQQEADYSDPYAESFNPLGAGEFLASPDVEVLTIGADGAAEGVDRIRAWGTCRVTDLIVANTHADPRDSVVRAMIDRQSGSAWIEVFRQLPDGTWTRVHVREITQRNRDFRTVQLATEAQEDGTETVLINGVTQHRGNYGRRTVRTTLRIDSAGNWRDGAVRKVEVGGTANRLHESKVDLDGDGELETITLLTDHHYQGGFLKIDAGGERVYESSGETRQGDWRRIVAFQVGQFDQDPALEIACLEAIRPGSMHTNYRLMFLEKGGRGNYRESDRQTLSSVSSYAEVRDYRQQPHQLTACDFDGNGVEAAVITSRSLGLRVIHMPGSNPGDAQPQTSPYAPAENLQDVLSAAVHKTNGQRRKLYCIRRRQVEEQVFENGFWITRENTVTERVRLRPKYRNSAWNGQWEVDEVTELEHVTETATPSIQFRLASGDLDGDSMKLRYTGVKDLMLADPLVIGVLAAAPAYGDSSIPQNRDACSTSLQFSSSRAVAVTVSTARTVSASVGYSVEDLFGAFGAEVKATVTASLEESLTESSQITQSIAYVGGAMEDTIIFQGTLYRRYQYEIVSAADPARIGDRLFIEDPVDSKIYQWPLEDYNELVDARDRMELEHEVGEPSSYMSPDRVRRRLRNTTGFWLTTDNGNELGMHVARGSGSNSMALELEESVTNGSSLSLGIGVEVEFQHSNKLVGGSFSLDRSTVHEITMAENTVFEGSVGGIASSHHTAYGYDYGLVVLQEGMDQNGNVKSGQVPYYKVTYWVD